MPRVWSVSALTDYIKSTLEKTLPLVDLEGEIGDWRLYPSGHAYFALKDAGAQIQAVFFKSALAAASGAAALGDGVKVKVRGQVSVYAQRGQYQLVVRRVRILGEGDLMQKYLELKARLEAEGLFDAARKRPLPPLPRRIGLVTSEAGAVVHDMATVLTRRFPNLEIRLFPCLVQGAEAPATIIAGLDYFNSGAWPAELVIVARGGGSFEDLYCFNDEKLVRALAASRLPVISAVGHETDFTLSDFAADVRAGTPSIAAELAVPRLADLLGRLGDLGGRLAGALRGRGEWFAQRLDHLSDSLAAALELHRVRAERRFEAAETKLKLLSPYGVLARGYTLTTRADGSVVTDAGTLRPDEELLTRFARGSAVVGVKERKV